MIEILNIKIKNQKSKFWSLANEFTTHPLFAGSFIMIFGSNAVNFLNYVYHLIMGRLLGPSNYGELAALFSLNGLLGIIPGSLSLVIIKYVSSSKTDEGIEDIVRWFNKKVFLSAISLFLLIVVLAPYISSFLNIQNYLLIILTGSVFLFSIPALFNRSVLQGLLRFKQMVISVLAETGLKLILGVLFVYLGFSVGGAVGALVVGGWAGWILSRMAIVDYIKKGQIRLPQIKQFFLYSVPVLIQSVAMTSIYSTDLILVKHFFSPHEAGIYASLSTLGKIIFFGTGPIGAVMFPLVAKKQSRGENYVKIFNYSLFLTIVASLTILTIYWLFPEIVIKTLYGPLYLEGANLLVWFGIFTTLFTLSSLYVSYNLSMGKTKVVVIPSIVAILQIIGIWIYHYNLMIVIIISVFVNTLLLSLLLIYSSYESYGGRNKFNLGHSPGI